MEGCGEVTVCTRILPGCCCMYVQRFHVGRIEVQDLVNLESLRSYKLLERLS